MKWVAVPGDSCIFEFSAHDIIAAQTSGTILYLEDERKSLVQARAEKRARLVRDAMTAVGNRPPIDPKVRISTTEVRYFIASIGMGVKRFARYVRGHWSIENTLHWCLDVTFREDENRVRERTTANNLAWLNGSA